MRALVLAHLMLLFASVLVGQRTWTVYSNGGPGIDFPDVPQAVAAAAPGDTILAVSDSSSTRRFTAPVIDKPLSLIGTSPLGGVSLEGVLEVRGIPSGGRVVLANIGLAQPVWTPPAPPPARGIWVHDCQGAVHLQYVSVGSYGLANTIVQFVDCAQLTLHVCYLTAPGSGSTAPHPPPECSVLFRRCNATILQSEFYSAGPQPFIPPPIMQTANSLYLDNSDVRLVGCIAIGKSELTFTYTQCPARYAVVQSGGTLTIGPATQLVGGATNDPLFPREPAVDSVNNGVVILDPNAYLLPYPYGCLCPIVHTRTIPAVLLERPIHNQPYRVQVHGLAGSLAILAIANRLDAGIPTPFGALLLDPQWISIAAVGLLDAQGSAEFNFNMHRSVPMNVLWAFQAGLIDNHGIPLLSLPAAFTVAWEIGRPWP